jgi:hypothetical protein
MVMKDRNRGQLILVGAIALAVVIASLSVALNTTIESEIRPADDASATLEDAKAYRSSVATTLVRLNESTTTRTAFETNVSAYETVLANATLGGTGGTIELTVEQYAPTVIRFEYQSPDVQYNSTISVSKVSP